MVVVEERGNPAGLRQAPQETRRERGRAAPRRRLNRVSSSPKPQVYIGLREGAAPPLGFPPQGVRQPQTHLGWRPRGGEGETCPPSQVEAPPPQTLGALGLGGGGGAHQPTWGWSPPTLGPCSPPGMVAPLSGPPGPSRWSRYVTDNTRNFSGDQNGTSHI